MKFILGFLIFVVAGYFAFQQVKPKAPPPAPPPPPPAILLEPQPVISEAEQAKIIKSANDMDASVRWEAIVFLDKMKAPSAYPVMFEKLHKDPEQSLRMNIIRLLAERKGPEITQNLVWALRDNEPEVRVEVLRALDKIGDYGAASAITEMLKDQEETVRVQALKTLNSFQDRKAAEVAAAQRRYEEQQRAAAEAARQKR